MDVLTQEKRCTGSYWFLSRCSTSFSVFYWDEEDEDGDEVGWFSEVDGS
jgi:hypothetical protein